MHHWTRLYCTQACPKEILNSLIYIYILHLHEVCRFCSSIATDRAMLLCIRTVLELCLMCCNCEAAMRLTFPNGDLATNELLVF